MTEKYLGGTEPQQYETIGTRGWSDPSRREAFEAHFGMALSSYAFEFGEEQYKKILAVDVIADGVVATMNEEFEGANFRSIRNAQYNNPDGTFSGGVMLFGASSREHAEQGQGEFVWRVNRVLEDLEANVRLSDQTPDVR